MTYFVRKEDGTPRHAELDHGSWPMLDETYGCAHGVYSAISFYKSEEYRPWETHEDMEAFIVLSGTGWAKVGDEEFELKKDTCFVAPAGVRHTVRCCDKNEPLMMYWFHAPKK